MGKLHLKEGMGIDEFNETIREGLGAYRYAWLLLSETDKRGYAPTGVFFGIDIGPWVLVGDAIWFPWASERNIIEASVGFFNKMRNEVDMIGYCTMEDKKFFEHIARHGILRRVGTLHGDTSQALFQTLRRKNG